MEKILNSKISFVAAIFTSFSLILYKLINIRNASWDIAASAMLFSLVVCLIISLFLTGRLTSKRKHIFTITAIVLFVFSFISFFIFQFSLTKDTVIIKEFEGDKTVSSIYFKGSEFTKDAVDYISQDTTIKFDDIGLLDAFENNTEKVWLQSSIRFTELKLSFCYFLFIITLVSAISMSTEILLLINKNKQKNGQP